MKKYSCEIYWERNQTEIVKCNLKIVEWVCITLHFQNIWVTPEVECLLSDATKSELQSKTDIVYWRRHAIPEV